MSTYSIIQKSQLEGAFRLDAEYYNPEFFGLKTILESSKTEKISGLSSFVKKGIFDLSPENYRESGVPFVRVQNIRKGFLSEEGLVFIPEEVHQREKKTELESLDLVLSKVGTVGEISIIPSRFGKVNFSQNTVGVKIDKEKIYPGYLLIYLLSKFGQLQLKRAQMFQVQPKLELQDVRELEIIRLGKAEKEIHDNVLEVERLQEESKSLYSQAEGVLLEELGLKDFEVDEDLYNIVNFSEIQSANRMDAEYFQPKYDKLISKLKSQKSKKIEEIAVVRRGSLIDPMFYNEGAGIPYIRGKDFSSGRLEKNDLIYISDRFNAARETRINAGDIVFALIGSVGTLARVLEEFDSAFISNNLGKISLRNKAEVLPEYLEILLHSLVGRFQFEREGTQTAQPKISDSQVRSFLIPILEKETQQKIAGLIRRSHESCKKAKQLLEEAKQKVEEMIGG